MPPMSHAAVAFGHDYGGPALLTEPTLQQSAAGKPADTACLKMQLHQWTPTGQSATAVADHDIALGTYLHHMSRQQAQVQPYAQHELLKQNWQMPYTPTCSVMSEWSIERAATYRLRNTHRREHCHNIEQHQLVGGAPPWYHKKPPAALCWLWWMRPRGSSIKQPQHCCSNCSPVDCSDLSC
jgi:hypothetical protein